MHRSRLRRVASAAAPLLLLTLVAIATAAPRTPAGRPTRVPSASTGGNLLANPGFEEDLKGHAWMPAAWDTFESGLSTVFFGRDTFLVHGGHYAVNVANVSTLIPMWHNWSQVVPVTRDLWGKDLVFSVWTRSNGLQGRAYVLLQAYRDTIQKMALQWKVSRDTASERMGIVKTNDPYVSLGWQRKYFSESETDWVRREVRVFVPPSANILVVRCGIFGTGQVLFDDASLTAETAIPSPPVPLHTNLLKDPSFEGDGNDWEYSMPPYEGMRIERDTTDAHQGKVSVKFSGGMQGWVQTRAGVCQPISNRNLSEKHLRLTGWIKTDSLQGLAYVKVYSSTIDGDVQEPTPKQFASQTPWTKVEMEVDTPPGTNMVWAWFLYNAPAAGSVSYDEVSLEVMGPARYLKTGAPPPRPPFTPSR